MTSLRTVIELNPDTFIVVTAPPGAAVRHYKNAATQTSVDAQVPSLVANRLDPAPRALSPPPQGDEMVSQTLPSPLSSRSTTGVQESAPSTTSDIEDPSSPCSDNIALAQQSDTRPPVHKPASSPSQALEPTLSPTPTTALAVPGPVPTTQIATFGLPGLSLGTSEARGPPRPAGRAILQDTSRPNQSPSFSKPNASIFARSSIGQSSLQAAHDSTTVATALTRRKRTYSFAVPGGKVQSSSDLPTSQAKRTKLETAGSFVREPAPFPMDVEAARRVRDELRREDQLPAPKITIPDPTKMMCTAGDFVLLTMNNRIFPYKIAELIVNTDEWRLEPYDQIVPAVNLPSQILGDTEAFSLQIQTFPRGLAQAASVLWPSDEVLPTSDWSPEGDTLYDSLLVYRGFVLRHLMETPETSPFRSMVADWFDFLKASPRAVSETPRIPPDVGAQRIEGEASARHMVV
ncbi:hypothetical protein EXIGLDRAFT_767139 [Exidia glandulosa HHB12029]|uniref:Uncharacterized protein n=1 Tax=Exidia glandulosa HHB12029 TaxID=1314781 RepID=A0A165J6B7_EXIGL|nr:hypothetical protein EXIGLDRAFT_767139 [Exidia glandulosa HHB12029]